MPDPIATAEEVRRILAPWTTRAEIAGSIRRRKPNPRDIEIVAEPTTVNDGLFGEPRPAIEEIRTTAGRLGSVVKGGDRYIQVRDVLGSGYTLDLFLVHPPAEWGVILAIRTGPADWSQELVTRIKGRLWRHQDGHVVEEMGRVVPCPTEEDFFRAARTPWREPWERVGAVPSMEVEHG